MSQATHHSEQKRNRIGSLFDELPVSGAGDDILAVCVKSRGGVEGGGKLERRVASLLCLRAKLSMFLARAKKQTKFKSDDG